MHRVNAYIKNGWDKQLVDPDHQSKPAERSLTFAPTEGWQELTQVYADSDQCFQFTNAQIISYFVTRTADDGLPASDFKSINSSALSLFRCGHVKKIHVCHQITPANVFIRADCLPEMKKDRVYKTEMELENSSFDIRRAQCGCPAGRGPTASCKHIAALCYALEEFSRLRRLPEFRTSTDKLQTWNQPRPRKLDPIPVETLHTRKQEFMPPTKWSAQLTRVASVSDPCPESLRTPATHKLEQLRCSLLALNKPCAFLHILVPDVKTVQHDQSYSLHPSLVEAQPSVSTILDNSPHTPATYNPRVLDVETINNIKVGLQVTSVVRSLVEEDTRQQSSSKQWFSVRAHRITSSICGRILIQKKKTIPLLRQCLYPKPLLDLLPPPIAWGRQNESVACERYRDFMIRNGHRDLDTHPCGFIIHPTHGWLGASPDTRVVDPSCDLVGIAEFKCPYSKRHQSPVEACSDSDFYCEIVSGQFKLKRHHQYFHQVQLQLYVSRDMHHFCDFCVYTPVDVAVDRIYPCKEWESMYIPQLEDYFDKHMLPEIVNPLYKPSYFL